MDYRDKKCLIAYFSRPGENYSRGQLVHLPIGNTQIAADILRGHVQGDMFLIEAAERYPDSYAATVERARQEKRDNARPALRYDLSEVTAYDVIFLGYPNWCGTMPMPVWTFLEAHDFSDKIIKPFCTHEGSGFGHSLEDIHALAPQAKLSRGITLLGTTVADAEGDIRRWLQLETI